MLKSIFSILTGLMLSASVVAEQTPASTATEATEQASQLDESQPDTTQQTAPQQAETAAMAEEQSGFSRGSVMRSIFTNGIEDREPVDNMKSTGNTSNQITYFTELRDMSGQTAKHRWEYNGDVMAEVEFNVRGPRWRVWSRKSLMPQWEGEWKVSVLNAAGEVISEELINYKQPVAEEAQPASAPDAELTEPVMTDSPQQ